MIVATVLLAVAPHAQAHLQDGFDRADSATIGAGWIEKNPGAFALSSGRAGKLTVGTGYRDNLVYRPASEDARDVEAAIELQLTTASPGYPQIAVRVQAATVGNADTLDSYLLYVPNSTTEAVLGRQRGTEFVTTLAALAFSEPLTVSNRYRMRLSARGANPVELAAYVERLNGAVWEVIGQANAMDSAWNRLDGAGAVGFGGYVESAYAYDNFVRIDLGGSGTVNPVPTTTGISPSQAEAGESGLIVVVYGAGFTSDSSARWNGSARATTYVSPSELEMIVTAGDISATGTAAITVANPAPGGGTSNAQNFAVTSPSAPPPVITALNPASVTSGTGGFTLRVLGTGFDSSSGIQWNGAARATTFVSATELTTGISAADVAFPGSAAITVARGMTISAPADFTIDPAVPGDFYDNFDRPNSATLGNGWLEKTPAAFSISGNEVAKPGSGIDYRDNVVYRPANEDLLNAEASVELRLLTGTVGYPQVMVRIQNGTASIAGQLDGYMLYLPASASQAVIARQRGSEFTTWLTSFTLSPALNATDRYRLRLRAQGAASVQLAGFVERWNGSSWQIVGQASTTDSSPLRIATAGAVGFSGYTETGHRYDNFARANLSSSPVPSPVPVATSLNPASASAGSSAFTLAVNGADFVEDSVVRWNGASRPTTFVSPSQLTAAITAADIASQGTRSVSVFNPAPGGGTSGNLTFTVTAPVTSNPVPVIGSLSPSQAGAGGAGFTLTVNGSSFVNGAVVRWNGNTRTTTFVSNVQLTAIIPAADIANAGNATVTVFNPAPGGGSSGGLTFTVNPPPNPTPVVASLVPGSAPANGPAFTLIVNGSSFVNAAVVRWNGNNRPTSFLSASQLAAEISASDIASQGSATVTVFNPTPGGGSSAGVTFTISPPSNDNPLPVLTSMSPLTWPTGGGAFTLSVFGSGFNGNSVIHWNGVARATTLVSANELRAVIDAGSAAVSGPATVSVFAPTPGGGRSVPLTLLVQSGSAQSFIDSFNRANNAAVGNGWIEKDPNAFSVSGSELVSATTIGGFPYNVLYRPASEARLDVEMSAELRRLPNVVGDLSLANFPQLHARVQTATIATPGSIDSYLFFLWDTAAQPQAMFAINVAPQPGVRYECFIRSVPLSEALVTGGRYRLRFRVRGTAPVTLLGVVERYSNGSWITIGAGTATHDSTTQRDSTLPCDGDDLPAPITNSGVTGLAKWENRTDAYDNFYWREVGASEVPTVSTLSPGSATAGGAGFTLTVNGNGFRPDSAVRWYGANRPTTFVSSTQLRATITAADIARSGRTPVTVTGDMGQVSSETFFSITPSSGTVSFDESFNRANSAALGNGWLEKSPSAFGIVDGRVLKAYGSGDYRDNLVYRPSGENALNVEALLEFRLNWEPVGYPALMTRVQNATAIDTLDAYVLLMDNSTTQAMIARQRTTDSWYTPLATFSVSQPLTAGTTYRMRLSSTGTGSVTLQAAIERLNAGVWQVIGQSSTVDSSAQRIATAGSVGFSGEDEDSYTFDNFRRTTMP